MINLISFTLYFPAGNILRSCLSQNTLNQYFQSDGISYALHVCMHKIAGKP